MLSVTALRIIAGSWGEGSTGARVEDITVYDDFVMEHSVNLGPSILLLKDPRVDGDSVCELSHWVGEMSITSGTRRHLDLPGLGYPRLSDNYWGSYHDIFGVADPTLFAVNTFSPHYLMPAEAFTGTGLNNFSPRL